MRVIRKVLRKFDWLAPLLCLAVLLVMSGVSCSTEVATKVNFLRDWEAAKEQAASDNKPIMINFYTRT